MVITALVSWLTPRVPQRAARVSIAVAVGTLMNGSAVSHSATQ